MAKGIDDLNKTELRALAATLFEALAAQEHINGQLHKALVDHLPEERWAAFNAWVLQSNRINAIASANLDTITAEASSEGVN